MQITAYDYGANFFPSFVQFARVYSHQVEFSEVRRDFAIICKKMDKGKLLLEDDEFKSIKSSLKEYSEVKLVSMTRQKSEMTHMFLLTGKVQNA